MSIHARALSLQLALALALACSSSSEPPPSQEPPRTPPSAAKPGHPGKPARLVNLCPKDVRFVIHADGVAIDEPVYTIAGSATMEIEIPDDHLVGHPGSTGGARTDVENGVVWFGKACKSVGASDDPTFDPV
jgi:hypothetical protein